LKPALPRPCASTVKRWKNIAKSRSAN